MVDKVVLKDVDPKSLRVYYDVLERWPKEDLKRDEALAAIPQRLEEVARAITQHK